MSFSSPVLGKTSQCQISGSIQETLSLFTSYKPVSLLKIYDLSKKSVYGNIVFAISLFCEATGNGRFQTIIVQTSLDSKSMFLSKALYHS
ncbi:MAG: hypothetical protein LBC61_00700 [Candidatus Peribacteria bacterium]|nr:hypothetical protein [Candidatus Peribacteria bacterium]